MFASALQIHLEDAEFLQRRLVEAAATGDAILGEGDEYGQRYILDFECVREDQRATVRSSWIVLAGESFLG